MKVTSTFNQFYVKRFRKKKGLDYTLGFSKKNEKLKQYLIQVYIRMHYKFFWKCKTFKYMLFVHLLASYPNKISTIFTKLWNNGHCFIKRSRAKYLISLGSDGIYPILVP